MQEHLNAAFCLQCEVQMTGRAHYLPLQNLKSGICGCPEQELFWSQMDELVQQKTAASEEMFFI